MKLDKLFELIGIASKDNKEYREQLACQLELLREDMQTPIYGSSFDDRREWCYRCEDLLGRAAFFIRLTKDRSLIRWTRQTMLWIADQPANAWIGSGSPQTPPLIGSLATAHICRGVSTVLLFCPDLFSTEELLRIQTALREKGIAPIDRYLEPRMADPNRSRNNWCIIELSGAMFAYMALGEFEKLHTYVPFLNLLHSDYNSDFYGETVGYWNYSFTGFYTLYLMCEWIHPEILPTLSNIQTVMKPFVWAYYHRQGLFLLQNFERKAYRALTFGDCNTIFEVKPDALLYIALYHEDERVRALAAECFCEPHTDVGDCVFSCSQLMLFPFFKQTTGDPLFLPSSRLFGDGYLMYKDKWKDPSIQIAIQTGLSELPHTGAHHHADQLSFQLAKDGVVLLDDPSRCCYKLHTQTLSNGASWHSVPAFTTEDGRKLMQTATLPKLYRAGQYNRLEFFKITDRAFAVTSEASDLYPEEITSLRRTFVGIGTHILVIVDEYETALPVFETASFVGNNRRDQMQVSFAENGGTMVREGVGVKIQALQPVTSALDYAALHDRYISSVESPYHGREGSGYILRLQNEKAMSRGRSVYIVFADKAEKMENWNAILEENRVSIFCNQDLYCSVEISPLIKVLKDQSDLLA